MTAKWVNNSYRYIAERLGEEKCRQMKDNEFPQLQSPGLFSGLWLKANTYLLSAGIWYRAYSSGLRPTHTQGVGGLGVAIIVDNPNIPDNSFFQPGRIFPVRIRHANLTYDDDRSLDVRAASLKFADYDVDSPLDLVMNTGDRCPFWNVPTVFDFMKSRKGVQKLEEWCFKNSAYYYNAVEGVRRAPTSYSHLSYYSQVSLQLTDKSGDCHYVRFRLCPDDPEEPESGLPDAEDQKTPWNSESARKGDSRPPDYLKKEYKDKLDNGCVKYHLQIQIYNGDKDSEDVFNIGKPWDLERSPWIDLANITIFQSLSTNIVQRMGYNIAHLPDCLSIPEAQSSSDYRSIGYMRPWIYATSQKGRRWNNAGNLDQMTKVQYKLTVQTSKAGRAGYEGVVYITITGSKGRTLPIPLDASKFLKEDFAVGGENKFDIEGMDVGDMWMVQFDLESKEHDGWYLDMVIIEKQGHSQTFPAYQWIFKQAIIRSGPATLSFHDNEELRSTRLLEKQKWRDRLPWYIWHNMPSHAKVSKHEDLPYELQFMEVKNRDFKEGRNQGIRNLLLTKFVGVFEDLDSFHDFTTFFKVGVGDVPAVADRWQSDYEFGRQFLQGCHPTVFTRITKLPENFPLKDQDVQGVLGRGVTLDDELDAGRVYMVDYKELEGIKTPEGRFVTPAMGIFYVNAAGFFLPIAIQLHQKPGDGNPIWTPHDSQQDWLCAKFFLKCADGQLHQMRDHLLMTHLIMEPFAVSLYRNLPRVHPVFKLLVPHVRYTLAINTIGRISLIGEGGIADKGLSVGQGGHIDLIQRAYKAFDYESIILPKSLKKRGVDDRTVLPNYFYRDDAMELWKAINQFVDDILGIYYHSDNDVQQDDEVQQWISEVQEFGLPNHHSEGEIDHNVPSRFNSIDDLKEAITAIIFTCSCEHAAQNFGQFDYYAFNPNAPLIMRKAPPTEKGQLEFRDLVPMLGSKDSSTFQIASTWTLSQFSDDELFLGDYPQHHFQDQRAHDAIKQFQCTLKDIERNIDGRNEKVPVPYTYLKPTRVPNSIAI
jgi:arachidonate 5-lipoxygenase